MQVNYLEANNFSLKRACLNLGGGGRQGGCILETITCIEVWIELWNASLGIAVEDPVWWLRRAFISQFILQTGKLVSEQNAK